ncbi:hypothetical protein C8Q76DRAFT_856140 [Earliella scabrosa]|nr:hypothetical protein C8Q76DRAFT_856140 [Earliella scabrosa]
MGNRYRNRKGWAARTPYKDRPRLSLELGERLGGGRTGVVYAARLVETPFTKEEEGAIFDSELCVKIARPNRSRTLAREAWVYDQLTEGSFQGASVPRCYGFFTATLSPEQLPVGLWERDPLEDDDPTCDDPLPDDKPPRDQCVDEPPGSREESNWVDWKPNPDAPLLSVLVTARGGARYKDEDDWDEDTKSEIMELLDDVSAAHVLHNDLRPVNIIRAPKNAERCKQHKHVHKWNLVDFAWSLVDHFDHDRRRAKVIRVRQRVAYQCIYFYTGTDR